MTMQSANNTAPELAVTRWFNTPDNPTLADLRGEVVVIETFQMLCPGCVSHGLPQAKRIQQNFGDDVTSAGPPHRVRTPRRHDSRVTGSLPSRISNHVPCRRGRSRPWRNHPHHHGSLPAARHPEPGSHRPGRKHPPQCVWPYRRPRRRRQPRPPYRRTPPQSGRRPRPQDLINCPATGIQPHVSDGFARPA